MPRKSVERDRMQRSTAAEIDTQTKGKGIRTPSSGGSDSSSKKRKKGTRVRIAQACNFCRNHKRRCSGTLPCELCARRGRAKEDTHLKRPSHKLQVHESPLNLGATGNRRAGVGVESTEAEQIALRATTPWLRSQEALPWHIKAS
ncbi:hypothetical protein CBOM_01820 [Ceraceosorus bombacis]|uniref:Zn(2)-C6 fungal-type domain-containing protein n=1 Tax=Ceraceosorus bombacis TaxID=401625 RepID=A0A0P1BDS6_9BASI|nr:hypothetical protein CBOM_01820 [Ceraceosorus bombacis]